MRFLPVVITAAIGVTLVYGVAFVWPPSGANPDPNHTHADFAVWISGKQLDFSDEKYMSNEEHHLHPYLHLHDGNGHVVHRHKPGLTLGNFLSSLGFSLEREQQLYVNGVQYDGGPGENPLDYVFQDTDKLLLTDAKDTEEITRQLDAMMNDACLYSKTCPWRGSPPTETCVADPAVPCRE